MELFDLLAPDPGSARIYGVVVGVVTNNADPDKLGRVKVKFPWLDRDAESDWARVAAPGVASQRGLVAVPEVDDEVLVAFEHGLADRPYVLGGLWNKVDKPPTLGDKPAQVRSLVTAAGHEIRLDDTKGSEKIEIRAAGSKSTIVLDKLGTITVRAEGDLVIESEKGAVKITGRTVEIASKTSMKLDAKGDLELKATAGLKQQGSTGELKADGPLTIKGGVVNIN